MSQDPYASSAFASWAQRARIQLIPKLEASALTMMLVPSGDPDIKIAVELGLSILMDKPLILVLEPGQQIPQRLRDFADAVIEGDLSEDSTRQAMAAAIAEVGEEDEGNEP